MQVKERKKARECVCACMFIHMRAAKCIYERNLMCVCTHVCVYMFIRMHARTVVVVRVCVCVRMFDYSCVCTCHIYNDMNRIQMDLSFSNSGQD